MKANFYANSMLSVQFCNLLNVFYYEYDQDIVLFTVL